MLQLTFDGVDAYASPARVGIGEVLAVVVPDGEGTVQQRWDAAAQAILETLQQSEDHTAGLGFLEARSVTPPLAGADTVAPQAFELRVVDNALPVHVCLTHPSIARRVYAAAAEYLGAEPAVFLTEESMFVTPKASALHGASCVIDTSSWYGPLDFQSGYAELCAGSVLSRPDGDGGGSA